MSLQDAGPREGLNPRASPGGSARCWAGVYWPFRPDPGIAVLQRISLALRFWSFGALSFELGKGPRCRLRINSRYALQRVRLDPSAYRVHVECGGFRRFGWNPTKTPEHPWASNAHSRSHPKRCSAPHSKGVVPFAATTISGTPGWPDRARSWSTSTSARRSARKCPGPGRLL